MIRNCPAEVDYQRLENGDLEDVLLFFPDEGPGGVFLNIYEGTGDNLDEEDIKSGAVDYVNYTTYRLSTDLQCNMFCEFGLKEIDGGMLLTKRPVKDIPLDILIRDVCGLAGISSHDRWCAARA